MSRGEIVLIPFPFTNLLGQKSRPCLVLHVDNKGEDCIVTPISSLKTKKAYPFDLLIVPSKRNGLKVNSVIKINKIATLEKKTVLGKLGTLEPIEMKQIDVKLKQLLRL